MVTLIRHKNPCNFSLSEITDIITVIQSHSSKDILFIMIFLLNSKFSQSIINLSSPPINYLNEYKFIYPQRNYISTTIRSYETL